MLTTSELFRGLIGYA